MSRVENWNPNTADETFENVAVARLVDAAHVLRRNTIRQLMSRIGTGKTTGISRPVYQKGKYAGKPWTAREFTQLMKSVRVTQKLSKFGKPLMRRRNVRVYVGHYLAYYADIFEYQHPFMRPALEQSVPEMRSTIGAK